MKKSPLIPLFLIVLIDLIGFGILMPILPFYQQQFGGTAIMLGLLMSSYSGAQFLCSPFWGRLSDRFGRRPILLTSIAGMIVSLLITGSARSLTWLFLGRIFGGCFAANISVASAYVADITKPEDRARGMGVIGAAFGLGFVLGPSIVGLGLFSERSHYFFLVACLSFLNLLLAFLILPEPPLSREERAKRRQKLDFRVLKQVIESPVVFTSIGLFFLVTLGFAQMESSFSLYLGQVFAMSEKASGRVLGSIALVSALIQGGLIGKLSKKFGEPRLALIGTIIMAVFLFFASLSPFVPLFVLLLLVFAVGYALTHPSLSSLVSRHAPLHLQGATIGVYQSAGSLARIIGPLLSGFTFDKMGPARPFQFGACFFALGAFWVFWGIKKKLFRK